jgi:hypothetical protein
MKNASLVATLALLALGGCDQPAPQDNAAAPAPVAPAEKDYFADRINAMPAKERNAVLLRAIKGAGGECQALTGAEPHAPVNGRPAWTAHCAAGGTVRALDWVVILEVGGIMNIERPGAL